MHQHIHRSMSSLTHLTLFRHIYVLPLLDFRRVQLRQSGWKRRSLHDTEQSLPVEEHNRWGFRANSISYKCRTNRTNDPQYNHNIDLPHSGRQNSGLHNGHTSSERCPCCAAGSSGRASRGRHAPARSSTPGPPPRSADNRPRRARACRRRPPVTLRRRHPPDTVPGSRRPARRRHRAAARSRRPQASASGPAGSAQTSRHTAPAASR